MSLIKSNILLSALVIALAIPTAMQLQSETESFVDVGRVPLMFEGFTADNVGSIVLGAPKEEQAQPQPNAAKPAVAYDQLAIQYTDSGWTIGQPARTVVALAGAPVRKSKVESDIFEHLRSIRSHPESLVQPAATDEQLVEYGLDEAQAFVVRCFDRGRKAVVADLLVGKDASQWGKGATAVNGVFVRRRDSRDVVLYEWLKPWRRSVEPKEWLDRTLFRLDPDKVRRFAIRNGSTGKRLFTFERSPNQARWQAKGADDLGALRQAEVEALIQRMRYVSAQSYERPLTRAGNMQALGLFPSQLELQLSLQEGRELKEITLQVGARLNGGRNEHYLTCSESKFLLTWPASLVTQFELDVAQRLFDPKPK